jgi:hypothetical protein
MIEDENRQIFEQWQNLIGYINILKRAAKIHNKDNENITKLFEDISVDMDMIAMTGFDSSNEFTEKRFNNISKNVLAITNNIAFNSFDKNREF